MMTPFSLADRIVFDLDDTLYPERDFVASGFQAVEAQLGIRGLGAACQRLFDDGQRRAIFDDVLAQFGLAEQQAAGELVRIYRDHIPRISLCPDAARYLRRHGRRFALITDGPERTQRNKIAALDLERYCDQIIPTGQWPGDFGKPHPRAFHEVEAGSGAPRYIYVADNAAKDFLAPNRLGWITVQILRPQRVHGGTPPDPDHAARAIIEDLDQLDTVLAGL